MNATGQLLCSRLGQVRKSDTGVNSGRREKTGQASGCSIVSEKDRPNGLVPPSPRFMPFSLHGGPEHHSAPRLASSGRKRVSFLVESATRFRRPLVAKGCDKVS